MQLAAAWQENSLIFAYHLLADAHRFTPSACFEHLSLFAYFYLIKTLCDSYMGHLPYIA